MSQGKAAKARLVVSDTARLYPPRWGGPRRIWNIFGKLAEEAFDITYVGLDPHLPQGQRFAYRIVRQNLLEVSCGFPGHYYFWHAAERILFPRSSLDLFAYLGMSTHRDFTCLLNSLPADIMVVSHPWAAGALGKHRRSMFIYDAHNCEFLLMEQILRAHPLRRAVLKRVRSIEADACAKSDLVFVCSEKEKSDFCALYGLDPGKIVIVPNGTALPPRLDGPSRLRAKSGFSLSADSKVVLFIGAYYKPNIDASRYIIETLAPRLPECTFMIVGSVSDYFKTERLPGNVLLTGWLDDDRLAAALCAADIAINPMFDGSGVNIKMLDYMAYGLPAITTACGARGIDTAGRAPFLITQDSGFSEAIRALLSDRQGSERMGFEGRALAEAHYDWDKIRADVQDRLLDMLALKTPTLKP